MYHNQPSFPFPYILLQELNQSLLLESHCVDLQRIKRSNQNQKKSINTKTIFKHLLIKYNKNMQSSIEIRTYKGKTKNRQESLHTIQNVIIVFMKTCKLLTCFRPVSLQPGSAISFMGPGLRSGSTELSRNRRY